MVAMIRKLLSILIGEGGSKEDDLRKKLAEEEDTIAGMKGVQNDLLEIYGKLQKWAEEYDSRVESIDIKHLESMESTVDLLEGQLDDATTAFNLEEWWGDGFQQQEDSLRTIIDGFREVIKSRREKLRRDSSSLELNA